jgi:hypothetical protein
MMNNTHLMKAAFSHIAPIGECYLLVCWGTVMTQVYKHSTLPTHYPVTRIESAGAEGRPS